MDTVVVHDHGVPCPSALLLQPPPLSAKQDDPDPSTAGLTGRFRLRLAPSPCRSFARRAVLHQPSPPSRKDPKGREPDREYRHAPDASDLALKSFVLASQEEVADWVSDAIALKVSRSYGRGALPLHLLVHVNFDHHGLDADRLADALPRDPMQSFSEIWLLFPALIAGLRCPHALFRVHPPKEGFFVYDAQPTTSGAFREKAIE